LIFHGKRPVRGRETYKGGENKLQFAHSFSYHGQNMYQNWLGYQRQQSSWTYNLLNSATLQKSKVWKIGSVEKRSPKGIRRPYSDLSEKNKGSRKVVGFEFASRGGS